jgi:very-short-patch-repair endonuclease
MKKRSLARSTESIQFARNQRRSSNEFASTVWQSIRNRLIADDGDFTEEGRERDCVRDLYLLSLGYKVLRIPGSAVTSEGGTGVQTIREFVQSELATQSPSRRIPTR